MKANMLNVKVSLNLMITPLALCHLAVLDTQDKESEKRSESFFKIMQVPKEAFIDFIFLLQRLTQL